MLQPALRARRTAVYEMMLENQGNTQASCRLHLLDPTGRVDGDFDPPAAGVEPGASSLIRLKVHANRLQWERRSRTVQFTIDADQPGAPTASAPVTFVQASMIPERLFVRLLALAVAVVALALVWFGIVKPAVRDAADDAVAKQLPAAISSTSVVSTPVVAPNPNDSVPVSTVAVVTPAVDQGKLFSKLLAPAAPAGQTLSQTVDVPAGSSFELTDFALQNPDQDTGAIRLLNGSEEIYRLPLANVNTGDKRVSWVSPIEVARWHLPRVRSQLRRRRQHLRRLHHHDAGLRSDGRRHPRSPRRLTPPSAAAARGQPDGPIRTISAPTSPVRRGAVTPFAHTGTMDDRFRHLAALAATQHSVISASQLVEHGVTASCRSKWERGGLISRLGSRSFAMAGAPESFERSVAAGLADLDGCGVVAGRAGARLLGLDGFSADAVEFLVLRHHRGWATNGLVCSTRRPLSKADIVTVRGFRCLTAERLILESPLFGFSRTETENAIDSAIRLRLVAEQRLRTRVVGEHHRSINGGRLLLDALVDAGGESRLERWFLSLVREAGICRPTLQKTYREGSRVVARVDAYFAGGLVVEVSGHGTHASRRQRQIDAQRHTELTLRGLHVVDVHLRRCPRPTSLGRRSPSRSASTGGLARGQPDGPIRTISAPT